MCNTRREKILTLPDTDNMAFRRFQFYTGRYTVLSNDMKNTVFQTIQDLRYYLVPIVRKGCHKKFSHSLM